MDQYILFALSPMEIHIPAKEFEPTLQLQSPDVVNALTYSLTPVLQKRLNMALKKDQKMVFKVPNLAKELQTKITFKEIVAKEYTISVDIVNSKNQVQEFFVDEIMETKEKLAAASAAELLLDDKSNTNVRTSSAPKKGRTAKQQNQQKAEQKETRPQMTKEEPLSSAELVKDVRELKETVGALKDELEDARKIMAYTSTRSRNVVIREMCRYLHSQIVAEIKKELNLEIAFSEIKNSKSPQLLNHRKQKNLTDELLLDLDRAEGWWVQEGNTSANTFSMDELWDAVYALSLNSPHLITAFNLTAGYMKEPDFDSRPKYKVIQPLPKNI